MEELKNKIIDKFIQEINRLDLSINEAELTLKYNSIMEDIFNIILVKREKTNVPLYKTSNNNDLQLNFDSIDAGKSFDTVVLDDISPKISKNSSVINPKPKEETTIPNNFSLTYEMKQFAQSKYLQNIDDIFEDFKLYYQSKSTTNADWEAVWKRWVLNQNRYKNHLVKTTIDENIKLDKNMQEIAQKHIKKEDIEVEFTKFKNHYIANGDLKVSWEKVWENWCINYKQFKPKAPKEQTKKQKEKADYKWDFRKAKEVSDRIKNWLRFEKKINWLDDYYWKDIPIPGIGWQKVMHPDFNKEEILLFKIDSRDGNFMLQHKTDDIIDAEVLEND